MAIADLADALEITGDRRHRAQRRADHRFSDEAGHRLRTEFQDFSFELVGNPPTICFEALVIALAAVGIAGGDVRGRGEHRLESRAPKQIASNSERTERIAVIALQPGDEAMTGWLPDLDEILARQLQGDSQPSEPPET